MNGKLCIPILSAIEKERCLLEAMLKEFKQDEMNSRGTSSRSLQNREI